MRFSHHASVSAHSVSHGKAMGAGGHTWVAGDVVVEDFVRSMPERYRLEFGIATARQHAKIAAARGRRHLHADLFTWSGVVEPGLCVVAPDACGLLAVIATGLILEGFDIFRADVFTRRTRTGYFEAIALFWLRRLVPAERSPLDDKDIFAIRTTLRDLSSGGRLLERPTHPLLGTFARAGETSLRFRKGRATPWLTLELETNDRPGLLAAVSGVLAAEGLQILDARIRTHGSRVHDYFDVLEADGSKITDSRLQRVELAVLDAVDRDRRGVALEGSRRRGQ